jgi:integrase/recombinase XerD
MLRPISPNTRAQYDAAIARGVPESEAGRRLLRAALRRRAIEEGADPEEAISAVPPPAYQIKRVREFLGEADAQRYEEAARQLPPGRRALALLPLALGLRAATILELERRDVQRATDPANDRYGLLEVLLKRGKEKLKACAHAEGLLGELLETPAAPGRQRLGAKVVRRASWARVGEILSPGKTITQYHMLHDLVRSVGESAGIQGLSPHDLRHAFASRMLRDGATIADVQEALDHESPGTTLIYLHGDPERIGKFMRQF